VGQVTCTPTFAERPTAGVRVTLEALRDRGIPIRIVKAGDRLRAGDVSLEVPHPPRVGPEGNENARSMVLLVEHAGHSILLTGDLDGAGRDRVLASPPVKVDVLMAPHHGSFIANTPELALWAQPSVVVSSQKKPRALGRTDEVYEARNAEFLATWTHGAVTVRSGGDGLVVEKFLTNTTRRLR